MSLVTRGLGLLGRAYKALVTSGLGRALGLPPFHAAPQSRTTGTDASSRTHRFEPDSRWLEATVSDRGFNPIRDTRISETSHERRATDVTAELRVTEGSIGDLVT